MSIALGATSLRNNTQCAKSKNHAQVNFGKDKHEDKKSHKGLYVTLGTVAGLAILALAFKKKIGNNEYVKKAAEYVNEKAPFVKDTANKVGEKTTDFINKAKNKFTNTFSAKDKPVNALAVIPKFSEAEQAIVTKYKMSKNKQPIMDVLKNHGMNDLVENFIKETFEKLGAKRKGKSSLSLNNFVNMNLKGQTNPNAVVDKMLECAVAIRKFNKI